MNYPNTHLLHPFPTSNLNRFKSGVLFLAAFGLITLAAAIVIPIIKAKLSKPPVYYVSATTEYVNPKDIEKNIKGAQITVIEPGHKALLPGAKWVPQTFNNCGPATTSMLLQYFGHNVDQNTTKAALRTNPDDKNVFTSEMRDYLKQNYNINSKLLYNGNSQLLKTLISNGFYVVVEDNLHPNEDIGHVTIIKGYDDAQAVFIADDSYLGVNIVYKYAEFDSAQWKPFNREYLPIYTPDREPLLKAILGDDWDQQKMYQKAVTVNKVDVEKNPADMSAWFNLGSSYYGLGQYQQAKEAFEKSRSLGWPKRMLWYQIQPIQTYNKIGDYQKAIELANLALGGNDTFAEAHLEKAYAYKGLGQLDLARQETQTALNLAPNLQPAKDFLTTL